MVFTIIKSSELLAGFAFRDKEMKVRIIEFELQGLKRLMHFDKTMIRNSKQPENRTIGVSKIGDKPNRKASHPNSLAEGPIILGSKPNGLR